MNENFSRLYGVTTAMTLTEEARKARLVMNMTQGQLAAKVGISLRSYIRFEKSGDITLKKFMEIIRALGRANEVRFFSLSEPRTVEESARRFSGRQRARQFHPKQKSL